MQSITYNSMISLIICYLLMTIASFASEFNDNQKTEIESIIHDYLINNPEVIEKAQEELDRRNEEAARLRAEKVISEKDGLLFASEKQSVMGNPEGNITLVEFFDYNCGFCKRSLVDILGIIQEDDQIKVVLKEFPVLGQQSLEVAQISIAANRLDSSKFFEFHQKLMLSRNRATSDLAIDIAEDVGYDVEAVKNMADDLETRETIEEVYELARNLSLTGTPAFVLGTEVIRGAIDSDLMKEKIDSLRNCGSTTC